MQCEARIRQSSAREGGEPPRLPRRPGRVERGREEDHDNGHSSRRATARERSRWGVPACPALAFRRGPAVYDDDDISHPALASAISPSRPGPTFPSPPSPPVPPIKSHLSSSANAAAAPRQRPGRLADLHAQPCPPLPTRLDRSADSSTSSHHRVSCHEA